MKTNRHMRMTAIMLLCVILCAALFGCSPHVHSYTDGKCACGEECPHRYNGGVCIICGEECRHEYDADSKCGICGITCPHDYENGVCIDCEKPCEHEYIIGICTVCGIECAHAAYSNGLCVECGEACTHPRYTNSVCAVCGTACDHPSYTDGACDVCEKICEHAEYAHGVCVECGEACAHDEYADGVCTVCGEACEHDYVNKVCLVCGMAKPPHYDYEANYADKLPRINISTVNAADAPALMTTESMGFNGQPGSKDDRPYYDCSISVSNCAAEHVLTDIAAQVKIRGNYTANYPKKPFRIKFGKKQAMLGLNEGRKFKSWVLLADYKDIAMTRNALTFYLSKQILGSDDYYSTDFMPVELYLNNTYWGMYLLAEQQQTGTGRVDIAEPDDDYQGTDIGYLIEYDGYYNIEIPAERFSFDYYGRKQLTVYNGSKVTPPDYGFSVKSDVYYDDVNNCAQTKYISEYTANLYKLCYEAVYSHKYYAFNSSRTGLVAYVPKTNEPVRETIEKVIDVRSLVDTYIINEIACDADLAWSSFYMSVDLSASGDGRMRFEAPWDFDSALGLKDTCASGEGLFAANCNNPWLVLFINESWFRNEIRNKWKETSEAGVFDRAREFIRSGREKYADGYRRNFDKWGFVKSSELNWTAMQLKDHAAAVEHLYDWFDTRIKYLDRVWNTQMNSDRALRGVTPAYV